MAMEPERAGTQIRLAELEEAPIIASVLREAFVEYEPLYTSGGLAATTPTGERIRARWQEGAVWVALLDGAIVGTVAAVPSGETLYIRSMAIVPAARGHGIGELLLREVEDYALEHAHNRLLLSTTPFLARAIRLYERFGFERSDEGPHDLFGTPLFTMVKTLEASAGLYRLAGQ
jgi:GNAT superfamily N-acetyltransferase